MLRRRWLVPALAGLVALACREAPTHAPEDAPAAREPVRLVVLVVVDQLPSWSFDPMVAELDGGLHEIVTRGRYHPRARLPYAGTHTAPGHATLGTGATPAVHGIVANRWWDPAAGRMVACEDDPAHPSFDPRTQAADGAGISNHNLAVEGLADALHRHHGAAARAVAIGIKSRAAAHVLGRDPDVALWFDPDERAMTTSTAFAERLPAWVVAFAAERGDPTAVGVWTPSDPARVAALAGGPDDAPGEADPFGLGHTFPHDVARSPAPAMAFGETPAANTLVVDTALAAIEGEALGVDDVPDLLAITFSAHDFAAHAWCQESWERVDHLLGIDRDLARLLAELDRRIGRDRYAVVLTSDHGATPSVERSQAAGRSARRIMLAEIEAAAERGAASVLGAGDWIVGTNVLGLSLSADAGQRPAAERDRVLAAVVEQLRTIPDMAFAGRVDQLAGDCDAREGLARLACSSLVSGRSGDVYFAAAPLSLVNDDFAECTAHGSPSAHDREVPLAIAAPGIAAGRVDDEVTTLQVAPTIAALLGMPPPAAARAPAIALPVAARTRTLP